MTSITVNNVNILVPAFPVLNDGFTADDTNFELAHYQPLFNNTATHTNIHTSDPKRTLQISKARRYWRQARELMTYYSTYIVQSIAAQHYNNNVQQVHNLAQQHNDIFHVWQRGLYNRVLSDSAVSSGRSDFNEHPARYRRLVFYRIAEGLYFAVHQAGKCSTCNTQIVYEVSHAWSHRLTIRKHTEQHDCKLPDKFLEANNPFTTWVDKAPVEVHIFIYELGFMRCFHNTQMCREGHDILNVSPIEYVHV